MKKYICILASAALFTACEQKTENVTTPAAADKPDTTIVNPPADAPKTESNTTIVNPTPAEAPKTETNTTINTAPTMAPDTTTTTTTTSTPNP